MKILSIERYKEIQKSKVLVKELEEILVVLDNASVVLNNSRYRKYIPVKEILDNIKKNKHLLKLFHKKYKLNIGE